MPNSAAAARLDRYQLRPSREKVRLEILKSAFGTTEVVP
jgi:hypothetical protein